ncbi:hypothetical protein ACHAXA_001830 [Cyclostephanos tholiformis]|uniref:DUF155 domain-containing protein n=1 Tax=Cyclostephanos tholiformis TaxID=382380 RepID=A0ABD3RDK6_9STRA
MTSYAAASPPDDDPHTRASLFHKEHRHSSGDAVDDDDDIDDRLPSRAVTRTRSLPGTHVVVVGGGGEEGSGRKTIERIRREERRRDDRRHRRHVDDDDHDHDGPRRGRRRSTESGHELTIAAPSTRARQRRKVGAHRRARDRHDDRVGDRRRDLSYDDWRGRVGVHVEYDDVDLKGLMGRIRDTLPGGWEIVDCYDVVRMWLPLAAKATTTTTTTNDCGTRRGRDDGGRGEPQSKLDRQGGGGHDGPGTANDDEDDDAYSTRARGGFGGGESGEGGYDGGDGTIHASMREVFVFGFGAVVFWNFVDVSEEMAWMERHLVPHDVLGHRHNIESIKAARDEMGFRYGDAFRWRRDVVQLRTRDAGEKMAVSFALSKSANISIYEWRMEQEVRRNAHIPEALAEHGELRLRRKEINSEIGRLYLLNNAINLTTNMLDTPEELWDDDRFQPEYDKSIEYLDVLARIDLLNQRLEVLKDLNTILMDAAQNNHEATLMWIVIVLIIAWLTVAQ